MPKHLDIAIENFQDHMKDREFPVCFGTKKDFEVWSSLEDLAPTKVCRKLVCRDCTKEYQKQMGVSGRCFNFSIDLSKIAK